MTKSRDISKLSAVEVNATADQTDAEVKAAVEAASDSNTFTDADHSKLNAIEASADVTDATNVTAAGALMDSELTNLAAVKAINQSLVTTADAAFASLDISGNIDVDGTTNLDVVDIDGLLTASAAIEINGAAGAGISEGMLIDWSTNLARFLTYDSSSGSEIAFYTQPSGGSTAERVRIKDDGGFVVTPVAGGHAVFNEGSIDADFRVESNGNTHALFVQGSSGNVGIGRTPVNTLTPSLEMVSGGSIFGYGDALYLAANLYYASGWKAMATGGGAKYVSDSNGHRFYTSASASAGATASPQERVSISTSGNVHLNTGVDARIQLGTSGTGASSVNDNSVHVRGNDDNLILSSAGNGSISLIENGSTRMFIKAGGNVGIGTTSPSTRGQLHVHNPTDNARAAIQLTSNETGSGVSNGFAIQVTPNAANGDKECSLTQFENAAMLFHTNNAEAMRIDSSGNVGIGISTVNNTYGSSHALQIASVSDNNWGGTLILSSADGSNVFSRLVASTDGLDLINTKSTNMRFFTNNTERMRIHASGGIAFGTGNDFGSVTSFCTQSGKAASVYRDIEGNGNYIIFQNSGSTTVGSITRSSSSTVYATSSDYRLKENVDYTWDATTRLKQLKPARFNWIADDTNTLIDGFLAHEVSSIVPEAVAGEKDAVHPDGHHEAGEIDPQGIDHSKLVPLLVKTIQELEARITALEA